MPSFDCQICGVDMAIARIRTQNEPWSAAWGRNGANYVGFSPWVNIDGKDVQDRECPDCTTEERNVCTKTVWEYQWPSDEDDSDWRPENVSSSGDEILEYQSDDEALHTALDGDESSGDDNSHEEDDARQALFEIYIPHRKSRLPHGTWQDGLIHYRSSGESRFSFNDIVPLIDVRTATTKVPLEHIAANSCQSMQGIHGHILSLSEMKNCRNYRLLLAKTPQWEDHESADNIFESDSLFFLTGESNGSMAYNCQFFYPAQHGIREISTNWERLNLSCDGHERVNPLPVHSYCLDIYGKVSQFRLGKVDLDDIWHWREISYNPQSYGVETENITRKTETERARPDWGQPWHHLVGDEWLAANPVEVPGLKERLNSCRNIAFYGAPVFQPGVKLTTLAVEIATYILSFLNIADVNSAAASCRLLYNCSQIIFKNYISTEMRWLWECLDGRAYPPSADWQANWDPLCPPGLIPPLLPPDLDTESVEDANWAEILAEDPDMTEVSKHMKAFNRARREKIYEPYEAARKAILHQWQQFRADVASWICATERERTNARAEMDWVRVWRVCSSNTTRFPGLRNRARIWDYCEEMVRLVQRAYNSGHLKSKSEALQAQLSDRSSHGWTLTVHGNDEARI